MKDGDKMLYGLARDRSLRDFARKALRLALPFFSTLGVGHTSSYKNLAPEYLDTFPVWTPDPWLLEDYITQGRN